MTAVTWETALEELEARLVSVRSSLAAGDPVEEPFTPPNVAGPVPESLAARAQAVLAATAELQRELEAEVGRISGELRRIPRRGAAPEPKTGSVDIGA
jgi:hypothetical protein